MPWPSLTTPLRNTLLYHKISSFFETGFEGFQDFDVLTHSVGDGVSAHDPGVGYSRYTTSETAAVVSECLDD